MKQLKPTSIALLSIILGLGSCQNEAPIDEPQMDDAKVIRNENKNLVAIKNYLNRIRNNSTRSGEVDLIPYIVNGDTVMYVANYDEGWEVFSNDNRLPMVLMKSETGSFNPYSLLSDNPFDGYFKSVGDDLQKIGIENTDEPEGMWQVFSAPDPNPTNPGTGQYQMVGLACETTTTEYTPRGGRLSTQWGQYTEPFNQFTPYLKDNPSKHSRVGCCAVAAGQFIYYYQQYFKPSLTTVTDAVYDKTSNTYSFTGSSNSIWNLFDNGSDKEMVNDLIKMRPTAIFLGFVGVRLLTKYGEKDGEGSSSNEWYIKDFIQNSYGLNMSIINFNYLKLINNLSSGFPTIAVSTGSVNKNNADTPTGHAYIIDYAKTIDQNVYEVYAYVTSGSTNPPGINPSEPIDNPYGPSLDYYRKKYGTIDYSYNFTYTERWIMMNWGWHGLNNDVMVNADLSSWIINRRSESLEINDKLTLDYNYILVIE